MFPRMSSSPLFRIARLCLAVTGALALTLLILHGLAPARPARGEPDAAPSLQIDKIGPKQAFAGDTITYTVLVTNTSGQNLTGIAITDTWVHQDYNGNFMNASGLSVVTVTYSNTQFSKFARFTLGDMGNGQAGSFQFTMAITSALQPLYSQYPQYAVGPTVMGNSVVITSDQKVAAGQSTADTNIVGPVLVLTKSLLEPLNPRAGRPVTYMLALENKFRSDSIDATNVVITEQVPLGARYYQAYPPNLVTFFPATNTVQWKLVEPVPVSSTVYVTLALQVDPAWPAGGQPVRNYNESCGVLADGLPRTTFCSTIVVVNTDDALDKVVETYSPPLVQSNSDISLTFMTRILTYTVYAYNPYTTTITNLRITDTLPQYNNQYLPTQTFQYVNGTLASVSGGPLPVVVSQTSHMVAWDIPAPIAPWGVYSFTFQAFVPPTAPPSDPKYLNQISGSDPNGNVWPTNDGYHDKSMQVYVVPQIQILKTAALPIQMYGQPITYTLVVSNIGPTTITNIQITDTLPSPPVGNQWFCGFQYSQWVSGDQPDQVTSVGVAGLYNNTIAWTKGFTLTGYQSRTLSVFTAIVAGVVGYTCNDGAGGYSPDTYIPFTYPLAPVIVDVPFRFQKDADPTQVILGGTINYTVREWNIGTIPAQMSGFTDTLPFGFFYGMTSTYYADNSPGANLTLQPNAGNFYQTQFPVNVLGPTGYKTCDQLPDWIPQVEGTFGMLITSPPLLSGFWSNASKAAYVYVIPQAQVFQSANPPGALPGGPLTLTVVLSNNTNLPITQVTLTETLPVGFSFGSAVAGTPDPIPNPPNLPNVVWIDLTIPAGSQRSLTFTAIAPAGVQSSYSPEFDAKATSSMSSVAPICMPVSRANFQVAPGFVEINKYPNLQTGQVGPLAQFDYTIDFYNRGPFTVTISRFTDTLPGATADHLWKFVSMAQYGGPPPVSTNPPVWTNLTLPAGQHYPLVFTVRTDSQVGIYQNLLQPERVPLAGSMTGTLPISWTFTKNNNFVGAPVQVVPGVGLFKEVFPESAATGQTVVYTITLVNVLAGNQPLNNVRLTDTLPFGFTYSQTMPGSSFSPVTTTRGMVVWQLGTVQNGDSYKVQLIFQARISDTLPSGTYYNDVLATADNSNIPPLDRVAPVVVSGLPALNLSKSVQPPAAIAGRSVTYTLNLANVGDEDVTNATIVDTLPGVFNYMQMISGPNPTVNPPRLVWNGINVPSHTSQVWIFQAAVPASVPDGTYYNQLDGSTALGPFQGTGPAAPVNVATPVYDLQVSKSDGRITNTIPGRAVYTLLYTSTANALGLVAQNVVLTDTFDPADYLNADAPGWNLVSAGVYTKLIGDLNPGATGLVTIALDISAAIPQQYRGVTNTVQIGAPGALGVPEAVEQNTSNNAARDIDTIRGADLAVVGLSYSPSSLRQGGPLTVAVTFLNQGVDPTLGPDGLGWFGADVYVKPVGDPPPTGPADRYLGACPTVTNFCPATIRWGLFRIVKSYQGPGLAPGETYVMTFNYVLPSGGAQWLYAQADTYWGDPSAGTLYGTPANGRIVEADEANNIYGPLAIYAQGSVYLPLIRKNR